MIFRQVLRQSMVAFTGLLISVGSTTAQDRQHQQPTQPAGQTLTLDQCLQIALERNPQILIAEGQVEVAQAQTYGSYTGILPTINASVINANRTTSGDRDQILEGIVIRQVPGGTRTNYFNNIALNYTLYNGGQNWNSIRRNKQLEVNSKHNVSNAENQIASNVKTQYYNLLRAIRLKEVTDEQVKLSEEQLRRSQSMYEIGSVAKIDVLQARAQLGQVRITLLNQQKAVTQTKANLNNVMGVDVHTPINPVDPIAGNTLAMMSPMSLQEATSLAFQQNPSIQRDTGGIQAANLQTKQARGGLWPTVSAGVTYSRNGVALRDVYGNYGNNWNLGLNINVRLPILNGTQTYANIQSSHAQRMIAEETLNQTKRTTLLSIRQSLLDLETSILVTKLSNENIVASDEGLRLAEERYRVGSGTLLDVFNAQVTLAGAKSNLVIAQYDYLIAQATLDQALGRK
jgi:TolC family type I secretion outer membrane protein